MLTCLRQNKRKLNYLSKLLDNKTKENIVKTYLKLLRAV